MSAKLFPLDSSVKYIAKVFLDVKNHEDFNNSCCHCQKQLFHGQISTFCKQKGLKALFKIVKVVFADYYMHFQIPSHSLHKKSFAMQTLPINRADLL